MHENYIKRPIIALSSGFLIILILISFLIFYTTKNIQHTYQQLENTIEVNNQKIKLNYKMRLIGRERSLALQTLFLLEDPFDLDDVWMRYNNYASEYVAHRQKIYLYKLEPWEKKLLIKQDKITIETLRIQNEMVQLLFEEDGINAKKLLIEKAIPNQDKLMSNSNELINKQEAHNKWVLISIYKSYKKEFWIVISIGLIILTISIIIAIYLILSINKLNNHLVKIIDERTTGLVQAKEYAEQATASKSHYLAYVTHEIRNPLHGMLGLIDESLEDNLPERSKKYLNTVQQSGEMLLLLLNDVLDLSKIEANKLSLNYLDFNLKYTLDSVIELLKGQINYKNIQMVINIQQDIPEYIHSDSNRLKQILINLVSNAIKFTPDKGKINIDVFVKKTILPSVKFSLFFKITDTGIGISEQNISQLFQAYQQADETIARQFGGTGLGLLLSRQLVEMMQGKIWVESKLGQGSQFSFYITCNTAKNSIERRNNERLSNNPVCFERALLAEDNSVNRQVAALALKKFVKKLDISHNGAEAVLACQTQQYDIIFMDCYMPILDGFKATAQIRQMPNYKEIPIIAMTGLGTDEEQQRCLDIGMNDVLVKPYKRQKLLQTLQKYDRSI